MAGQYVDSLWWKERPCCYFATKTDHDGNITFFFSLFLKLISDHKIVMPISKCKLSTSMICRQLLKEWAKRISMSTFRLSFPATRRFSMSSTALVGLSRFIKTSQVVQLAFPLTQLPGQTFSQCLGLILAPALLILDVPRMNMVSER